MPRSFVDRPQQTHGRVSSSRKEFRRDLHRLGHHVSRILLPEAASWDRRSSVLVSRHQSNLNRGAAVGHHVPPATPMMRLSGCRHPLGFGLIIRESRGGLQSVLGCIQNQVPFVVFLTRVEGAEGNRNILFAHAEESADANDQRRDTTFLVDQDVIDLADLIVRRIVNVLLIEVGHGGPGRQPAKDLSGPRSHWRGLLRNGRSTDADGKCDSWDDLSHDRSAPVDRMSPASRRRASPAHYCGCWCLVEIPVWPQKPY